MTKLKYLISPKSELTVDYIGKAIMDFQTRTLPNLNKLWNYYSGKQKIIKKVPTDVGKPCNIVMRNFCQQIVNNYNGYLTGIPITYSNDDFKDVIDILNYNDTTTEDTELLKNALIFGRAFECNYVDEEGKQRFKLFSTKECLPVYSNTLNGELLYVIRFYQEDLLDKQEENYIVEVYGPDMVQIYRSAPGFTSFNLIDQYRHWYNQCPVTVFSLNEDEESIYSQIIYLQDAYNEVLSNCVDDSKVFSDAYLVFKGVRADAEDLMDMKRTRTMGIDNDADVEFLTKDVQNTEAKILYDAIKTEIFTVANAPDFSDEKFMAQSGEAIKYKLVGFETIAGGIENNMRKALQRRIELICSVLSLTDLEETWRDVDIRFTRNLPNSLTPTTVSELMQYKGLVSDRTLLEMVPFIKDPDDELKRMQEQTQKELEMTEFGHNGLVEETA